MRRIMIGTVVGILLVGSLPADSFAQQQNIAIVYRLMLDKQLAITPTSESTKAGDMGDILNHGDNLLTGNNTRAAIRFTDDGSIMRMNASCTLQIRVEGERTALRKTLDINFGEIWAKINKRENAEYRIETPTAVAAVKGTEFYVRVERDGTTTIITIDGVLDFFNDMGTVEIPAGFTGVATEESVAPSVAPTEPEEIATFSALSEDVDLAMQEEEDLVDIEIQLMDENGNIKTMVITLPRSQAQQYIPPAQN